MSRHSPTRFAFGVIAEVVAVVFLVSLLPRIGLKPETSDVVTPSAAEFMPAADAKSCLPVGPANIDPFEASNANEPSSPRYVEQRLDRASQKLISSVGLHVASAAGDILSPRSPSVAGPQMPSPQSSGLQNRRWLRY